MVGSVECKVVASLIPVSKETPVMHHHCRRYDKICKVEPFARSLKETDCDCMVNGRRRDHGAERAHLTLFDVGGQGSANCQVSPPALHPITANRTLRAFTQLLP